MRRLGSAGILTYMENLFAAPQSGVCPSIRAGVSNHEAAARMHQKPAGSIEWSCLCKLVNAQVGGSRLP